MHILQMVLALKFYVRFAFLFVQAELTSLFWLEIQILLSIVVYGALRVKKRMKFTYRKIDMYNISINVARENHSSEHKSSIYYTTWSPEIISFKMTSAQHK